ncbi:MAG: tyrosine-protein phosphatase [Edaphobacter sp.]|uniref:tyrosine-protein phosphatase n=1 Tax=Edaphobacter sp. TaxID=1934404 RepID=UPI0023904AA0|nr:tyrosine-protein phosphatase [Edaphobacter sp.]MDE1178206.1 tyrosine-protein phosphatase [Edaphobacter sp.]
MRSKLALCLLSLAASAAYADVTQLQCVQSGSATYKLTYTFTGDTHGVQIFAADTPDVPTTAKPLTHTKSTSITLNAGKPGQRMYFVLKADTGEVREVSIRHLDLEGTPNFRDIGGYETADGRFVRWGLFYRSGVLSGLTPADLQYLAQLNIRVVCDFRTKEENDVAPEKWVDDPSVQRVSLPIGSDPNRKSNNVSLQQLLAGHPTAEQLRERMRATYGSFVFSSGDQFATLFRQVNNDHLPLLYHCTAGKDRTGIFSALLLLTLGVPEKTVLEDYALTNQYLHDPAQIKKMTAAAATAQSAASPRNNAMF